MMRLTKVEVRRLFSRRFTSIALLAALIVTGLMLFGAFVEAQPLSGAELTSQRLQFDQEHKAWEATGAQQIKDCKQQQAEIQKTQPAAAFDCNLVEPVWGVNWGKPTAKFTEMMPNLLLGGGYLLAFVGFVLGAGFVSAEFSSGSMGNWLTFEPRRTRVYVSKLAAAGLGLVPVAVALLGVLIAGTWLIVGHFASTAGTTASAWGDLLEIGGRSVALTLAAGVAGAAMGMLVRHTAAVIGIAMGYLVLVEGVLRNQLQGVQPWLLQVNFNSWLQHSATYFVQSCTTDAQGSYNCQGVEKVLSFGHASAYLGVLVVLLVGLGALVFRRRDVT